MKALPDVAGWVRSLVPDLDSRVENFRVDSDFLDDELFEAFKEEVMNQSLMMRSGVSSVDVESIRMAAHSVKGMGGTMGLPEISVLAHEIELRSRDADLSKCYELVAAFVAWVSDFFGD
jgi:chemotaxis protein histidine kinase CheA